MLRPTSWALIPRRVQLTYSESVLTLCFKSLTLARMAERAAVKAGDCLSDVSFSACSVSSAIASGMARNIPNYVG